MLVRGVRRTLMAGPVASREACKPMSGFRTVGPQDRIDFRIPLGEEFERTRCRAGTGEVDERPARIAMNTVPYPLPD